MGETEMQGQQKKIVKQRATVLLLVSGVMVAVHLIDLLLGGYLKSFGIQPRALGTAYTLVTAPWLHGDFAHLGSNLSAFIVLAALCLLNGVRYFVKASAIIIVGGGALVWLFGREATHIGASGWIFGLWSLAMAQAWLDRSYRNIVIALGVLFFYGGMVFGIVPQGGNISFESHLFGAVAGIVAAFALARKTQPPLPIAPRTAELKFWPEDEPKVRRR
jgi:membrane associated rhomboid family serine protease